MNFKDLEQMGLSVNEAKTYLALLELGSSGAGIIAEKSGLHRRAAYDALDRLVEKGLAGFVITNGTRRYEAAHPEKLKERIQEEEELLKTRGKEVDALLPSLLLKYQKKKSEIIGTMYAGKDGLKTVMELILKEGKPWYSIGSSGKGSTVLPYFLEGWHQRRLKKHLLLKALVADTPEAKKRGKELLEIGLADVRVLSSGTPTPQTVWIFGNKTAIILVSEEHPMTFVIESKEIADSFHSYFELLWKHAKRA